jgi:LacI family transcriptional regulator
MSKKRVTIHDIAKELNVAASTVSRALQDHPRISLPMRKAVQKLAAKYDYRPNHIATSLRRGRGNTVGVIVPRINRNFFSNVIGGMEEELSSGEQNLIICQTRERYRDEVAAIQTMINARVNAVVMSISIETNKSDHIDLLLEHGIKLYFFDRVMEGVEAGAVMIDDRLGAYLSVRHLLDQGYRKIIHVAGSKRISIYDNRRKGYLEAMTEAGIEVPPDWIIEKPLVIEGGESAFETAMNRSEKPDAMFCSGDFAALGVLQAARKKGLRLPEDLGLTGFANEPFTAFVEPPITTVDQHAGEMGRILAKMCLACCNEEEPSEDFEKIVLKPELIVRKSSLLKESGKTSQ